MLSIKSVKRVVSMALVCAVMLGMFAILPVKAEAAISSTRTVTGCFNSGTSWGSPLDVYTNGKAAKLRICTFNQAGKRTSGKISVKAVSDSGAVYMFKNITGCNGISNSTTNVTLPKGNTHYTVYISRANNSNDNLTKCYYNSIDFKKNCWHY